MVIRIKKDRIEFDNFTLRETSTGFTFDGQITADGIVQNGFQGSVAGFTSGGGTPSTYYNVIDKFRFDADSNATDVGDLFSARRITTGQSSQIFGYTSGGYLGPPFAGNSNTIDKFPFASLGNATDVGDLPGNQRRHGTGHSSSVNGYTSGGNGPPIVNTISKFPFAIDTNATSVGVLNDLTQGAFGHSSSHSGYVAGGVQPIPPAPPTGIINTIQRFPFATDSNSTVLTGKLNVGKSDGASQSSTTSGYLSVPSTGGTKHIEKYPFATDSNATYVGDLSTARVQAAGQSSTVSGYTSGGNVPGPNAASAIIDKFPFASDSNASSVGNLSVAREFAAGQQH